MSGYGRAWDIRSGLLARISHLTESAVRNWVRQFDVDAGVREGVSTGELEELRRLRSENRQLRMERDIPRNGTRWGLPGRMETGLVA